MSARANPRPPLWVWVVLVVCLTVAGALLARPAPMPAGADAAVPPSSAARTGPPPRPTGRPFITSISTDHRYFLDQYGKPLLVRGDSPWSLMTDLSPEQAKLYFADRERKGFNAVLISLIGAVDNGAPYDDGRTYDGVVPFEGGDVTRWNQVYFDRVDRYLNLAADHGITVFLYPIDGWTLSRTFRLVSNTDCLRFGEMVADRMSRHPNVVWLTGGDYFSPSTDDDVTDNDQKLLAMYEGLRSGGDRRLFSIQLNFRKSISSDSPLWNERIDWNFVYTYFPTYKAVLEAYDRAPVRPALFGEGGYEDGPNLHETAPRTHQTLRRQALWALTSGSPGEFYGSLDWEFRPGWESRLDTPVVAQMERVRDLVAAQPWWQLIPDQDSSFLTSGRAEAVTTDAELDPLENDYATAALTPDGTFGLIYLPTARTVTIDRSRLAKGVQAYWVDPASGATTEAGSSVTLTAPGRNADRDSDWLLVFHR